MISSWHRSHRLIILDRRCILIAAKSFLLSQIKHLAYPTLHLTISLTSIKTDHYHFHSSHNPNLNNIVDKNSVDSNNNFSLDEDFDVNFLPDQTDLTADVNMFDEPPAAVNSSYMAVTSTNYTVGGSAISNNGAQYSTTQQNQIVYRQPQMHYQQQQQHQQQQIMQLNGYSYGGGKQFSNEQTNYMNNEMNNLNNSGSLVHHLLLE